MDLKIYCLYDSKAEAYAQPFFMRSRGEAIRGFSELANDANTQVGRYPDDFTLFELGSWDPIKGTVSMHGAKISLGTALEFKSLSKNIHLSDDKVTSMKDALNKAVAEQ